MRRMGAILHGLFLVLIIVPGVVIVVRFFYWLIDRSLHDLARLERDADYRARALDELDRSVAERPSDAALRRQRADVRRFEERHDGVVEDLTVYLQQKPKDDAGWAELAESLRALGQHADALSAAERAAALDPRYVDHHALRAQTALLAGNTEAARAAVAAWEEADGAALEAEAGRRRPRKLAGKPVPQREADPRLPFYRAALALASGQPHEAGARLAEARTRGSGAQEDLARDPALQPLLTLGDGADDSPSQGPRS